MAETTTRRLGLRQWSDNEDTLDRTEFNTSFKNIEDLVAIDRSGPLSSRPAPGLAGTFYTATDNGITYRDTGLMWIAVGAAQENFIAYQTGYLKPAITAQHKVASNVDLIHHRSSTGSLLSSIDAHGGFLAGGVYVAGSANGNPASRMYGASLSVNPQTAEQPGMVVRGLPQQVANLAEYRTANGAIATRVDSAGGMVTRRISKDTDTDATTDAEFVTKGQMTRSLPEYTVNVMTLDQYNGLLTKNPKTVYMIVG